MKSKTACLTPGQIEGALREKRVRPTTHRVRIAQYVLCEADHPTAEQVHAWALENITKVSLATVYNTLNTLVAAGLLRMVHIPESDKTVFDHNVVDHFHFLDEKTGRLYDLEPRHLSVRPNLPQGFKVRGVDVVVRGNKI